MSTDLVTVDRYAVSVVSMLEHAKSWLATAVETTGPAESAAVKAQIVTAETYARELRLSKDIQQDAQEMVGRAEYALGKSIRKGQEEGTVAKVGTIGGSLPGATRGHLQGNTSRPTDFASKSELYGKRGEDGALAVADNAEPEHFEEALAEARTEGNLSRANVVRKVKGKASPNKTRAEKADLLEDLARQGFSSRQMCKALGFGRDDQVRTLAREYAIEIPADRSVNNTRRIDSTRIVVNTATALEGLVAGVELIDYEALDIEEAGKWADSLNRSLTVLRQFSNRIGKATQ